MSCVFHVCDGAERGVRSCRLPSAGGRQRRVPVSFPSSDLGVRGPRVDDRWGISDLLPILRAGLRWRAAPACYGPPNIRSTRFRARELGGGGCGPVRGAGWGACRPPPSADAPPAHKEALPRRVGRHGAGSIPSGLRSAPPLAIPCSCCSPQAGPRLSRRRGPGTRAAGRPDPVCRPGL